MDIRECKECGASELDEFISRRLLCRRCAVQRAADWAGIVFDKAAEHALDPKDELHDACTKMARQMTELNDIARVRAHDDQTRWKENRRQRALRKILG